MDNEAQKEIQKLGLQEFPATKKKTPERPIPIPEQIEKITKQEQPEPAQEKVEKVEEVVLAEEGGSKGEIGGIVAQGQAQQTMKEREKEIDRILSEGLEEMYLSMTPEKQQEFKQVGEETTRTINEMLASAKVKAKKIINLIRDWLSIIPGANKFFLEQETKIRADKIMNIKD